MTLSTGTRLGPYEILSPLGAGGMGEVYRAKDSKLRRDVAIKVLPESLAANPEALARFEREALAVAALSHPNILSIFDFGTQDGISYAVMELLEGETLRGTLDAGPISQKQALDYALQVAKGLSAAHEKGIVHRDLKPENLFVAKDGHLKILDFGLAKRTGQGKSDETSSPTQSKYTEPGVVMGSVGYMSPEQVRGLPVDHRSDIFSFGAILYEVLSGTRAFRRDTASDTMAAVMRDEPPDLSESGRNIVPALERIVGRCLRKSAADRFSSARDVLSALGGVTTEAPPASRDAPPAQVSIAVLPFSDMSAAKDQEYLCEGMAEEIMNALVRIDGIRVASRTSAFRAGRNGDDLAAISRALCVGHVLEGSVRTAGVRLRVTAQLTDVASGYQLWSERFDREAIDVFAIQDEIATGVVDAVKARLGPRSHTVHARPQAHDLEAYRSYLKGRHLRGVENFGGAMAAFEEAVRLDPAHAPSWTGLAEITVLSAHMGMIPPRAACTAARKALATAKELQGESAESLHVEAFAAFLERRWDAMETAWRRALELQPDHVLALGSFGISLCARQRLDEALPLFERAREADPLASFPYTLAGWGLLTSGRPEEGLRHLEDALTFEKEDASAICGSSMANVALGSFEDGIAAAEHGVAVARRAPFFVGVLGWALAAAGRDGEARTVLEELRARPAASPTVVSEAWLLGALGEIDDAFDVLARAEEEHQGLLCYTGLPGFDPLRGDSRFAALQRRLGLTP